VPTWRSATMGVEGSGSYTAFGYANPARRVLAGVLHTRADVRPAAAEDNGNGSEVPGQPHLEYSSDVIEVVGTYLYQPGRRLFDGAVRTAKRLQSGRLDAYLLYMLIALIAIIAVVTALA
jgi:hydrogenase-4 component B